MSIFDIPTLDLARAQFAFVVAAHIVFPAFSIGTASYLMVLEALRMITGKQVYQRIFEFWKHIFAVVFGMGVVSGVVMSYEFGLNFAHFSDKAGPVIGPLMGYEVMTAFFLEAGFLGIMLFGRNRVNKWIYMFAVTMVAVGTLISAFWILSVNSWMQTPQGFKINDVGQFIPTSWLEVIFNPSLPYRFVHMVLAAYLTTALVVAGVGAWHHIRGNADDAVRTMFRMAIGMILVTAPIQIFAGDQHGLNTLEHQPAKIAAMEGHWETSKGAGLILFGIPNPSKERTDYKIEVPYASSLILTHSLDGEVPGLGDFPPNERPPMTIVFFTFRIMVGLGFAFAAIGLWGGWLMWRKRLHEPGLFHKVALVFAPGGFLAIIMGWFTTEFGRQPYTIYGHFTTAESVSSLTAGQAWAALIGFVVVYAFLFGSGTFYLLRLMRRGPEGAEPVENTPQRAGGVAGAMLANDVTTEKEGAHA
ncbi:cytochrome ubiquinol oxidase subunit I [Thioclava sp. JM3]|uniref:Cytochrome ubiquinol oxidase subunit I n=1 Tax=Thioclava nitratireducens TaxID=1915078 RepID=A0ABM6IE56_9RHOB|nr:MULTISPECIES: cytochrome ubiquinol oxidase subunit I [Thioclava]AQS47021.1 cytochrome ubiquinol oxidase subunit I [Thioclava nitratireducens]OWY11820.1 cytochrome ubiquinol oxidase subunit I [Thioclava sp. F34-6]OWY15826.1 cytochrome ubiquinol oxidase subunit I [Thioclava sp. JM3]